MNPVKAVLKAALALTPYRIVRQAQNRFQAIDYTVAELRRAGFAPDVIVDGGAHLGEFSRLVANLFPNADIHMVEPQPACLAGLRKLGGSRFHLHAAALGDSEDVAKGLKLSVTDGPTTGAHVAENGETVPVAILDSLVELAPGQKVFIKLDLQGYELHALRGAERVLAQTEVLLTEVSFFAQMYEPPIITLMQFLDARGFDLFDIAALSPRTRDQRLRQGDFIFVRRGSALSQDTNWE